MKRAKAGVGHGRVDRLTVRFNHLGVSRRLGTLAWSARERVAFFEYDRAFAADPLPLSPFRLDVRPGAVAARREPFDGLHGLFNDSLPDGWGRLLVDRRLRKGGVDSRQLSPLDRLAIVGGGGMGALTYEPDGSFGPPESGSVDLDKLAHDAGLVEREIDLADIDALQELQGGSGGARPKVVVALCAETGRAIVDAGPRLPDGFSRWIVKFRSREDPPEIGAEEYAYALMARAAGVEMSEVRLIETQGGGRFFATERFDRTAAGRAHVQTVGALLEADHRAATIDYDTLLKATRLLTRDERHLRAMFARMAFNVLARNRDDHAKNHAFIMDKAGAWSPAPAYDLTLSAGPGGEHTLAIAGEGRNPGIAEMLKVAAGASIGSAEARATIDATRAVVDDWPRHADQAGVPAARRGEIDGLLNGPRGRP